jgi:hypothetical protein
MLPKLNKKLPRSQKGQPMCDLFGKNGTCQFRRFFFKLAKFRQKEKLKLKISEMREVFNRQK